MKVKFLSLSPLSPLIPNTEYNTITDFRNKPIDELSEKRENKKSCTLYWDVSLNIKENDMIRFIILKPKERSANSGGPLSSKN